MEQSWKPLLQRGQCFQRTLEGLRRIFEGLPQSRKPLLQVVRRFCKRMERRYHRGKPLEQPGSFPRAWGRLCGGTHGIWQKKAVKSRVDIAVDRALRRAMRTQREQSEPFQTERVALTRVCFSHRAARPPAIHRHSPPPPRRSDAIHRCARPGAIPCKRRRWCGQRGRSGRA